VWIGHLHVVPIGLGQAAVDGRGRRAPVLVQLEADGSGANLLFDALRQRRVALSQEPEVHRQRVHRLQHQLHVTRSRRAGGGVGTGRRSGAAADERGDAARQRLDTPVAG
jgi:hypothetical protein